MSSIPSGNFVKRAAAVLLITCIIGFGTDMYGLVNVQLVNGNKYKLKAESQQLSDETVSAKRGVIYDCNMNVLAQSAEVYKIYIDPSQIDDDKTAKAVAKSLSEILDVDYTQVYADTKKSSKKYIVIKSQVENTAKKKITKLISENSGYSQIIGIETDTKRYYPYHNFASSVIGFTGADDTGLSGLEYYYNTDLTGIPGRIITAKNAKSYSMSSDYDVSYKAQQGTGLVLTIDQVIQYYLDSALQSAVDTYKATYGYGIVMDVDTGAILAMTTLPDYDPNTPYEVTDSKTLETLNSITDTTQKQDAFVKARYSQWRNRTISDSYEPGSVFKCITAAAAIEEGVAQPDDMFDCTGSITIADRVYHCHNHAGHGVENFTTALMNSCNPIFIEVAEKLGAAKFYKYFDAFGFTEKTGIDLPSEFSPKAGVSYYTAANLGAVELASCSFGQSFQISPIQMISAIAAIANGGKLMTPYLVASMLDEDGNTIYETKPTVKRQVISKSTATKVSQMMEAVVSGGTAKNAYVAGYRVAGKTGTSQKLTNEGQYIGSFVGFAPEDDPQIAVLIVIDEPQTATYGGTVAAPAAAEVIEKTLVYLGVEPEYTDEELAKLDVKTGNYVGQSVASAKKTLTAQGFSVKTLGSGSTVLAQSPVSGQVIPKNGVVYLYSDSSQLSSQVTVPDLLGLSVTDAEKKAVSAGINIKISGYTSSSDVAAYKQSVTAGTSIAAGTIVTVSFQTTGDVSDVAD